MGKSKFDQELEAGAMNAMAPKESTELDLAINSTPIARAASQALPAALINIDSIRPSPFQSRADVDETHIENLMAAISEEGLLSPVVVRPIAEVLTVNTQGRSDADTEPTKVLTVNTPDPVYELIAGHNRVEAMRRLGRTTISATIRHMSDAEAARALTSENTTHRQLADWELYKHIKMLRAVNAVKNNGDLARLLNFSRTKVQLLEAYASLPVQAAAILDKQPDLIGYRLAHELREFSASHPEIVVKAIEHVAEGKLKQAGVAGWIQRKVVKPPVPYRKEVAIKDEKRTVKLVMTNDEARVTGDIDFDKLHALIEKNLDALRKEEQ